jgi:pilus assembly protein CpaB
LLIAIAIACGALAMVLLYSYLGAERQKYNQAVENIKKQQEAAAQQAATQKVVNVLVAAKPLQVGVQISMGDLATQTIPLEAAQPGSIDATTSNIVGMIAVVPMVAGEQILQSKIAAYEKPKLLSDLTPPGKRAVPVAIENFSTMANMLKPGDNVDILASVVPPESSPLATARAKAVTLPLFQNVSVLLVGNSVKKSSTDAPTGNTITLALTPQEAALVEFVSEQGKIRAVMRSNGDMAEAPVQVADWNSLFEYLYPDQKGRLTKKPTVEIYRGLQKETVPLGEGKKQ